MTEPVETPERLLRGGRDECDMCERIYKRRHLRRLSDGPLLVCHDCLQDMAAHMGNVLDQIEGQCLHAQECEGADESQRELANYILGVIHPPPHEHVHD